MIEANGQNLNRVMQRAKCGLEQRPTRVETGMIRLRVVNGQIITSGTDGTLYVEAKCPCNADDVVDVLVGYEDIDTVTKYMGEDDVVSIQQDGTQLILDGYGTAYVNTASTEYYPTFPVPDAVVPIGITKDNYRALGLSCMERSNVIRDSSVHVYGNGEKVFLTTTSAGEKFTVIAVESDSDVHALVNYVYLGQALKAMGNQYDVGVSENLVYVRGSDSMSIFPLNAGNAYSGERIFGMEVQSRIRVLDRKDIVETLTTAIQFSDERGGAVIRTGGDAVQIWSYGGNEFHRSIAAEPTAPMDIMVSAVALIAALKDTEGDNLYIDLLMWPGQDVKVVRVLNNENEMHIIVPFTRGRV